MRQPERPCQFHRHGIQSTHAVVERNRLIGMDAWHRFRYHLCPLSGRKVVRFQDEAVQSIRKKLFGQIEVVDPARNYVRRYVDLQIVTALLR